MVFRIQVRIKFPNSFYILRFTHIYIFQSDIYAPLRFYEEEKISKDLIENGSDNKY